MDPFENILSQYKDYAELMAFASSQYKTIIQLSKKSAQQDEEIKHLKHLLEQNVPALVQDENSNLIDLTGKSDSEIICITQLALLKDISMEREITLEESRKLDTYTKLLIAIRNPKDHSNEHVKKLDDGDLLKLVVNDTDK
jgi:hypothetical protein